MITSAVPIAIGVGGATFELFERPKPSAMAATAEEDAQAKPVQPVEITEELRRESTVQVFTASDACRKYGESEAWCRDITGASHHMTHSRREMHDFDDFTAGKVVRYTKWCCTTGSDVQGKFTVVRRVLDGKETS